MIADLVYTSACYALRPCLGSFSFIACAIAIPHALLQNRQCETAIIYELSLVMYSWHPVSTGRNKCVLYGATRLSCSDPSSVVKISASTSYNSDMSTAICVFFDSLYLQRCHRCHFPPNTIPTIYVLFIIDFISTDRSLQLSNTTITLTYFLIPIDHIVAHEMIF